MSDGTFFLFDWSTQSLVFPLGDGRAGRLHVRELQALGYTFDETEARWTLPRFDKSLLAPALPTRALSGRVHPSKPAGRS